MTDHDLIREAREWARVPGYPPHGTSAFFAKLGDALEAAVARETKLREALGLLGGAVELHHNYGDERHPSCGVCDALTNAEDALARVPAEPATEEEIAHWGHSAACVSCGEERPNGECSQSNRPCAHHCNHSWSHDECCWCGESMLDSVSSVSAGAGQVTADTIEQIRRRWTTEHDRGAHDYTDAGCRVLAEHAFCDIATLLATLSAAPADTIEKARRAIERFVLCSDTRLRDGMSPDQRLAYQGLLTALAAVRTPEEQT